MEIESIPTSLYLCFQIVFKQPEEVNKKFLSVIFVLVWVSDTVYIYQ